MTLFEQSELVGRYRVEKRIGAGGMGAVYRAWDPELRRPVALKRVLPGRDEPASQRRLRREARALAQLDHPSIARVFDLVTDDQTLWIVFEWLDGETVAEYRRRRQPPLLTAVRWFQSVADGLATAHAGGILHRDLKVENVFVTREGAIKILDFGISEALVPWVLRGEESTISGASWAVGTPRAMAPEQILQQPLDARSDLFSFGVFMYEVVTGDSPFKAMNTADTLRRVVSHRQVSLSSQTPEIPVLLSDLVDELLEKDPRARPEDASVVARRLAQIEDDLSALVQNLNDPASADIYQSLPTSSGRSSERSQSPEEIETLVSTLGSGQSSPWPGRSVSAAESASHHASRDWRLSWVIGIVLTLGAVALIFGWWLRRAEPKSLIGPIEMSRVSPANGISVIAPLLAEAEEGRAALAMEALEIALSRHLDRLARTVILNPRESALALSAPDVAAALGADVVIRGYWSCVDASCEARLEGPSGEMVTLIDKDLRLVDAMADSFVETFKGARREVQPLAEIVSAADFETLLDLRQATRSAHSVPQLESILQQLEEVERRSPDWVELVLLRTLVLRRIYQSSQDSESLREALAAAARARFIDPRSMRPIAAELRVALAGNRLDRAGQILDELDRSWRNRPDVEKMRAWWWRLRGRPEQALKVLRRLVLENPSVTHLYELAFQEVASGSYSRARQLLERALELAPEFGTARGLLAQVELLDGRLERASSLFEELLAVAPDDEASLSNLGQVYMLKGSFEEALPLFERAQARLPANAGLELNLADVLQLLGRSGEATKRYERVLKLTKGTNPGWQELSVRAQALAHLGKSEPALEAIGRALEISSRPETQLEAAVVYAVLGQHQLAAAMIDREIEAGRLSAVWRRWPWLFKVPTDNRQDNSAVE